MSGIKRTNLDALFSQYVRARAGWRCEYSGDTQGTLDCAHVLSRRHRPTRWDPRNAICLSRRWHMWFTEHPHEWADWTRGYLGPEVVDALQELAYSGEKITQADQDDIADDLYCKVLELGETPVCTGKKRAKKKAAKKRSVNKANANNTSVRKREQYRRKVSGEVVKRETEI